MFKLSLFTALLCAPITLSAKDGSVSRVHYSGEDLVGLKSFSKIPTQVVSGSEAGDVAVYSAKAFSEADAVAFIKEHKKRNADCRVVYIDSERSNAVAEFCQQKGIEWLPLDDKTNVGKQVAQYLAQSVDVDYSFEESLKKFKFKFWTIEQKQGYKQYSVNYHRSRLDAGAATDDLEHIITPHVARADGAWVMKTTYPEKLSPLDLEFLKRGFHIVCVDESKHFGNETSVRRYQRFIKFLQSVDLAGKGIWTGSSLDSLAVLNWASQYPESVMGICLDAPVVDFDQWAKNQTTLVKNQFLYAHNKKENQFSTLTDELRQMASKVSKSGVPLLLLNTKMEGEIATDFLRSLKENSSLVSMPKKALKPASDADHLMRYNGLLNREELYLRRTKDTPLFPHLSDAEMVKNYQAIFKFPQEQKFDAKSDYFEKKFPAIKELWYKERNIAEEKHGLVWKVDARHPKNNPKGVILYSEMIESLAELSRAYLTQMKNQEEAKEVRALQEDIEKVLVPQILELRKKGERLPRVYAKYLRKFSKYAAGSPANLRRAIGEQAWGDIYSGRQATAYNNMDGIRFDSPLIELMNIFPTEKERAEAIKRLGRHMNRVFLSEFLVTSEGAVIHHNIFHYAYASYSIASGYRFIDVLHAVGCYFSAPVYEKMKKAAMLAADEAGHFRGVPPANYGGRAGGQSGVGRYTGWLEYAARFGTPESPTMPDARILSYLEKYAPESKELQKYKKNHPEATVTAAKDRVWTVNRGAQTIQQYGDIQASAGGSSYPFKAHAELYMLARRSNYFQGLFMKQGSLLLRKKHVDNGQDGEFHPLFNGYAASFIPGTTTDGRSNLRALSIKTFLNSGTGGIGGGTSFLDNNTAMWAGAQTRWPGVRSRKSMFFFGDRVTCLTSNIIPSAGSKPASRWDSKPGDPIITTLYQWQHGESQPQVDGNRPSTFPYEMAQASAEGNVVVDRYGNSYVIHPDSNLKVKLVGRTQSQVIFDKKYLKHPISEKHPNPMANRTTFTMFDKKKLLANYKPVKGYFDLAYLEHSKADGSENAKSTYTVIVRGGKDRADKLNEAIKNGKAPYKIYQQNRDAHVLYDKASKTMGYSLFVAHATTPKAGVVESCSSPAFMMWRDDSAVEKSLSFVNASPYAHKTAYLTLRGKWSYTGEATLANRTEISTTLTKEGNTVISIHTPAEEGGSVYIDNVDIAPIRLQLKKL